MKQLIVEYDKCDISIIGVQEVPLSDVSKYGIISGEMISERLYKIKDLVEKPSVEESPSNIAILGRYIVEPEIFEVLESTKPGAGGEIQLTDALNELSTKQDIYAYNFEGNRYDVGNKLGFLQATVEFALKREDIKDEFRLYLEDLVSKSI